MPTLVLPSVVYKESFCEAKRETIDIQDPEWIDFQVNQFDEYLAYCEKLVKGENLGNAIQQTRYWLVEGNIFLGEIHIRHYPSGKIPNHIYYEIARAHRNQGYGKLILKLGLVEAKKLGLAEVIVVCDETNSASRKIIEANGGGLIEKRNSQLAYKIVL